MKFPLLRNLSKLSGEFRLAFRRRGIARGLTRLFIAKGARKPANIGALGIVYAVPTDPDGSGTIHTVDASTMGLVSGNSMIITLHVDHNMCFASIDPPTIGAVSADPCCGVLKYHPNDSVSMSWRAKHPHDFATYSFTLVRGVQTVMLEGGSVAASTSPQTQTVDHLLKDNLPAGCPMARIGWRNV